MRVAIISLLLLLQTGVLRAQDIILKHNGEEIEAIVDEITDTSVKYRRFSNPDGPLFSISKEQVFRIIYRNGSADVFEPPTSASSAATDAYPYPPVTKRYAVGDLFDEGGVTGVVFWVEPGGAHGLLMSMHDVLKLPTLSLKAPDNGPSYYYTFLSKGGSEVLFETLARNHEDGWQNMLTIGRCASESGLDWKNFPAFLACRDLGAGWYLPADGEMQKMLEAFNGGNAGASDKAARNKFNTVLAGHNAAKLVEKYYLTSTEYDKEKVMVVDFGYKSADKILIQHPKGYYAKPSHVRPVHKF